MQPIATYRDLALGWLEFAAGDNGGRAADDPVYRDITEGRDPVGSKYSSCGDVAHWLLFRLGVRLEHVNRDEHEGWKVGVNVSRLVRLRDEMRRQGFLVDWRDAWEPEAGDIAIVWSRADSRDAHVICVTELQECAEVRGKVLHSVDGGQARWVGGKLLEVCRRARPVTSPPVDVGGRHLQVWLPLPDVLRFAEHHGKLVDASSPPDTGSYPP